MMRKANIAIIMSVHKNSEQANRLVNHLSKDFDVYVHIDKRCSVKIENAENIFVYQEYKTYWGSFNFTMATLFLLKKAYLKGYSRYLLISGQDLPIKTNKEIIAFFDGNNTEYIEYYNYGVHINKLLDRVTKYYPNFRWYGNKNLLLKILFKFERIIFEIVSMIKPRPIDYEFHKGTNWVNFTHKCVSEIFEYLEKNPKYIKRFKWSYVSDEIFFHTLLKQLDEGKLEIMYDSLRYIDWDDPSPPKVLRKEDYEKIINSDKLFARKFDMAIDKDIIDMIYDRILCEGEKR